MPDFRKFKSLRIDLENLYGYDVNISNKREKGWNDTLYFYPKTVKRDSIYVYYDTKSGAIQVFFVAIMLVVPLFMSQSRPKKAHFWLFL